MSKSTFEKIKSTPFLSIYFLEIRRLNFEKLKIFGASPRWEEEVCPMANWGIYYLLNYVTRNTRFTSQPKYCPPSVSYRLTETVRISPFKDDPVPVM